MVIQEGASKVSALHGTGLQRSTLPWPRTQAFGHKLLSSRQPIKPKGFPCLILSRIVCHAKLLIRMVSKRREGTGANHLIWQASLANSSLLKLAADFAVSLSHGLQMPFGTHEKGTHASLLIFLQSYKAATGDASDSMTGSITNAADRLACTAVSNTATPITQSVNGSHTNSPEIVASQSWYVTRESCVAGTIS